MDGPLLFFMGILSDEPVSLDFGDGYHSSASLTSAMLEIPMR